MAIDPRKPNEPKNPVEGWVKRFKQQKQKDDARKNGGRVDSEVQEDGGENISDVDVQDPEEDIKAQSRYRGISWKEFVSTHLSRGTVDRLEVINNKWVKVILKAGMDSSAEVIWFSIDSPDRFERNLEAAQNELGIEAAREVPVVYKTRVEMNGGRVDSEVQRDGETNISDVGAHDPEEHIKSLFDEIPANQAVTLQKSGQGAEEQQEQEVKGGEGEKEVEGKTKEVRGGGNKDKESSRLGPTRIVHRNPGEEISLEIEGLGEEELRTKKLPRNKKRLNLVKPGPPRTPLKIDAYDNNNDYADQDFDYVVDPNYVVEPIPEMQDKISRRRFIPYLFQKKTMPDDYADEPDYDYYK